MYNYKSTNINTYRAYTLFLECFPSFSHPRWSSLGVSWLSISSCSWCSSLKLSVSGACGRRSERLKIFQSLSAWIGGSCHDTFGEDFFSLNPRFVSLQFQFPKTSKLAERNGVVFSFFFFQWKWTFDRPIIYSTPIGDWCGFSM